MRHRRLSLSFTVMISTFANCPTWSFHETYFIHLSKADSWGFPGLAASRLHGAIQLAKLLKKACNLPVKPNTQLSFVSRPCFRVRSFHPRVDTGYFVKPSAIPSPSGKRRRLVATPGRFCLFPPNSLKTKTWRFWGILSRVDVLSWSLDLGSQSFIIFLKLGISANWCYTVTSSALVGVGNGHGLHNDHPGSEARFGRWISEMMDQWLLAPSQITCE